MNVVVSHISWFSWLIFGALAGWVASLFTGHSSRMGCVSNMVIGIISAILGGWLYSLITGHLLVVGWNWTAFLVAVLGAIVLLTILNLLSGPHRPEKEVVSTSSQFIPSRRFLITLAACWKRLVPLKPQADWCSCCPFWSNQKALTEVRFLASYAVRW